MALNWLKRLVINTMKLKLLIKKQQVTVLIQLMGSKYTNTIRTSYDGL